MVIRSRSSSSCSAAVGSGDDFVLLLHSIDISFIPFSRLAFVLASCCFSLHDPSPPSIRISVNTSLLRSSDATPSKHNLPQKFPSSRA